MQRVCFNIDFPNLGSSLVFKEVHKLPHNFYPGPRFTEWVHNKARFFQSLEDPLTVGEAGLIVWTKLPSERIKFGDNGYDHKCETSFGGKPTYFGVDGPDIRYQSEVKTFIHS